MNIKTAVQLILFTIILGIFYVFYFVYFKKNFPEVSETTIEESVKSEIILTKEDSPKDLNNQNESNIIKNIEYKSTDRSGNDYILRAKIGEIDIENKIQSIAFPSTSNRFLDNPIFQASHLAVW